MRRAKTGAEQEVQTVRWSSRLLSIVGLFLLLGLVIVLATSIGSVKIPLGDTWRILIDRLPFIRVTPDWSIGTQIIVWDIRLPRVLLAGTVGMALSVAGATYQGLFHNPLADPYLIGVAQGSALGAVIGFLLPVSGLGATYGLIPALAFAGALASVMVVYSLARETHVSDLAAGEISKIQHAFSYSDGYGREIQKTIGDMDSQHTLRAQVAKIQAEGLACE
jgi:ABC-type Fe3+-siderophore transport system permease subunit